MAKEGRKEKTTIAAEERAAKTAKEKDERDYQQAISLENVKTENIIKAAKAKGTLKDPKDYLSKLSQQSFFEVQETIDPYTKEKKLSKPIFNQAKYDQFTLFANQNNINPDDTAYRLWRKYVNEGNPQPKQDKNSGNVVTWLKSRNISDEISAAEAIKELRAKKWTDEQINAAFDELGL